MTASKFSHREWHRRVRVLQAWPAGAEHHRESCISSTSLSLATEQIMWVSYTQGTQADSNRFSDTLTEWAHCALHGVEVESELVHTGTHGCIHQHNSSTHLELLMSTCQNVYWDPAVEYQKVPTLSSTMPAQKPYSQNRTNAHWLELEQNPLGAGVHVCRPPAELQAFLPKTSVPSQLMAVTYHRTAYQES